MINRVRGLGLEPRLTASKADVLPLDDPRSFITNIIYSIINFLAPI